MALRRVWTQPTSRLMLRPWGQQGANRQSNHTENKQTSLRRLNRLIIQGLQVAGGKDESVTQPVWTPKNELLFVSDRTGWWNIYKYVSPTQVRLCVTCACLFCNVLLLQSVHMPLV